MKYRAALTAMVALSSPAAAQDGSEPVGTKTVEGAQSFLADFYRTYPARGEVSGYQAGKLWAWKEAPGFTFRMLEGTIAALAPAGRCRSAARLERLSTKRHNFASPFVPYDGDPPFLTVTVDWSTVSNVRIGEESMWRDGVRVPTGAHYIHVSSAGPSVYFVHASQNEAARAAFAMDYLKTECGLKSEQGF